MRVRFPQPKMGKRMGKQLFGRVLEARRMAFRGAGMQGRLGGNSAPTRAALSRFTRQAEPVATPSPLR